MNTPAAPIRRLLLGLALTSLAVGSGCGVLDPAESPLFVFTTHHATPENGEFPAKGGDDRPRKFLNDQGWEVTLLESYVTMSAVSLIGCDGVQHPMNMFWGPCPEDLRRLDLATVTVAGNKLPAGDYCELWVEYGPYDTPVIDDETAITRHQTPSNDAVIGSTVYLKGGARQTSVGDATAFELRATGSVVVKLDVSQIENGAPLNVGRDEPFPVELTISKTYDRFFDGIDFETNFDPDELEGDLLDILEENTRISFGSAVTLEDDPQTDAEDG